MNCLRCGYCCIKYNVIIVDDPARGIAEDNVVHKPSGLRCKHLQGNTPGQHSCAVHGEPWYAQTPCAEFSQIERGNTDCRMGTYVLAKS